MIDTGTPIGTTPSVGGPDAEPSESTTSAIKDRLGKVGRSLKKLDLRTQIVEYPFASMGIAAAAGAIVGLVRPMPERGRVSSFLMGTLGALTLRLVRDAALRGLGTYAKDYLRSRRDEAELTPDLDVEGGRVRYTPAP